MLQHQCRLLLRMVQETQPGPHPHLAQALQTTRPASGAAAAAIGDYEGYVGAEEVGAAAAAAAWDQAAWVGVGEGDPAVACDLLLLNTPLQ